ncbi:MAG: glycosyltransferase family 4 protein, partial [Cystobacter sp.]
ALLIGSPSFAAEVMENHPIAAERFTIVPGATDVERFRPAAGRRPGDLQDPPVLLYHGRVDARKGVLDLLEACAILRADGVAQRLLISGIGPDLELVRRRVTELGLDSAVEVLGAVPYEQAHEVYARGDIFLSPTYAEGFSNTILEAMASGLPIVSTRAVGVVDCLEDGRDALLVPPRDADALAGAIARMLDDTALRQRLARTALTEVRELYSWQAVGRQIQGVYADLTGTTPDTRWTGLYDPRTTHEQADPSCRFRSAPHLL